MKPLVFVFFLISGIGSLFAQSKILLTVDGFQGFSSEITRTGSGFASLGFELEHKLDFDYGLITGIKYNGQFYGYGNPVKNNDLLGGQKEGIGLAAYAENQAIIDFLAIPVGFFYYPAPHIRLKAYSSLLFKSRFQLRTDRWYEDDITYWGQSNEKVINSSINKVNLDIGAELTLLLNRRFRVNINVVYTGFLDKKEAVVLTYNELGIPPFPPDIQVTLPYDQKKLTAAVGVSFVLFRVLKKKL